MNGVADFFSLPHEILAVIVAPMGLIVAWGLRLIVTAFLNVIRFDRLAEHLGIGQFLRTGQVPYTPSRLAGLSIYWLTLVATLVLVSGLLDLNVVTSVTETLLKLAPGIAAAVLVTLVGLMMVAFLANVTLTLARNAGWSHSRLLARGVRILGIIVVLGVATEQVGLNLSLLHSLILILAGGLALGLALAFGLGGQELARQTLKSWAQALSDRDRPQGPDLEG